MKHYKIIVYDKATDIFKTIEVFANNIYEARNTAKDNVMQIIRKSDIRQAKDILNDLVIISVEVLKWAN